MGSKIWLVSFWVLRTPVAFCTEFYVEPYSTKLVKGLLDLCLLSSSNPGQARTSKKGGIQEVRVSTESILKRIIEKDRLD